MLGLVDSYTNKHHCHGQCHFGPGLRVHIICPSKNYIPANSTAGIWSSGQSGSLGSILGRDGLYIHLDVYPSALSLLRWRYCDL
jgi:hypothetical protein